MPPPAAQKKTRKKGRLSPREAMGLWFSSIPFYGLEPVKFGWYFQKPSAKEN